MLKSKKPIGLLVVTGTGDMSWSGIWACMFEPMLGASPPRWFALLFSSASASQNALWVIKLSLLHNGS